MVESESDTHCHPIVFSSDGFRLKGILHLPPRTPAALVIGSHGLLSSAGSPKQIALARRCTASGLAFFRFDHRGCGDSQGIFREVTTLSARCRDLLDAAETLTARPDIQPVVGLFGSSMGGAVCLAAAQTLAARALVTVAAPVRSRAIAGLGAACRDGADTAGVDDPPPLAFDVSDKLAGLNRVLIFHGNADTVVPVENAVEIHRHAVDPKKLVIQKDGDHPMSCPSHQREFVREATAWFRRYLTPQAGTVTCASSS